MIQKFKKEMRCREEREKKETIKNVERSSKNTKDLGYFTVHISRIRMH